MLNKIDINCDLGESALTDSSDDAGIMPYISSCNIACGFHAGQPDVIAKTIRLALKHDVAIGAHPSYADKEGFGRREMNLSDEKISNYLEYQILALKGMVEKRGAKLHHVKLHGALYHRACKDPETAAVVTEMLKNIDFELAIYAPGKSALARAAREAGLSVCSEVFTDRRYEKDGNLRSRKLEGAVLHTKTEVLTQLKMLVEKGTVISFDGDEISLKAETICLHSDTPNAVKLAKAIHHFLTLHNVEIAAP